MGVVAVECVEDVGYVEVDIWLLHSSGFVGEFDTDYVVDTMESMRGHQTGDLDVHLEHTMYEGSL